ncbi:hypothetical protein F9L16_23840 [Agarivorans sp. B2Z047]|uniref:hypothetical protein n=1 Tax=Agarivorans sp. B2Z047 TaxID=2652721 RepID=UPI00128E4D06|nr:hypothetical protein [Agarivorans sp. B2Z047]MPW31982.1 hypothetical protein [Agarivorans sp. B2Z047]UQN41954.1 hypothetical protein LQZ07_19580 [Agarivorans sp. B2Z047]
MAVLFFSFSMVLLLLVLAVVLFFVSVIYVPYGKAGVVANGNYVTHVLVGKKFHYLGLGGSFLIKPHCVFIDLNHHIAEWENTQSNQLAELAQQAYLKEQDKRKSELS